MYAFDFLAWMVCMWTERMKEFTAADSRCRQNLKNENFTLSFGRLRQKKCTKESEARVARLFSLIQPMKSLICSVLVAIS